MLRAYDKPTGKEVGAVYMPAPPQSGSPMTYMLNGKQYIVPRPHGRGYLTVMVTSDLVVNVPSLAVPRST